MLNTIHHMPATGGTIISKAIAAVTNSILLSEINPAASIHDPNNVLKFKPAGLLEHLVNASGEISPKLKRKYFLCQLEICMTRAMYLNRPLLLREHSIGAFKFPVNRSVLLKYLDEESITHQSILSVRHPLDSFISSLKRGWLKRLTSDGKNFEEYCQSLLMFSEYMIARPGAGVIRYEDFCIAPDTAMKAAGEIYGLDIELDNMKNVMSIPATGLSGRKSETIEVRERQDVSESLSAEAHSSVTYQEYCARFGYEPDATLPPVRHELPAMSFQPPG